MLVARPPSSALALPWAPGSPPSALPDVGLFSVVMDAIISVF